MVISKGFIIPSLVHAIKGKTTATKITSCKYKLSYNFCRRFICICFEHFSVRFNGLHSSFCFVCENLAKKERINILEIKCKCPRDESVSLKKWLKLCIEFECAVQVLEEKLGRQNTSFKNVCTKTRIEIAFSTII